MSEPRTADGRPTLLLATRNPDKQHKLRWVVQGLPFSLQFPPEDKGQEPPEAGVTLMENASAKAVWWSRSGPSLCLASDGGLVVPALGPGWDVTRTRRQPGAVHDTERIEVFLARLGWLHGPRRQAYWVESIALAESGTLLGAWQAAGPPLAIRRQPSGQRPEGGFWLDTLLADPSSGLSLAELTSAQLRVLDRAWRTVRVCVRRRLVQWQSERGVVVPIQRSGSDLDQPVADESFGDR